MSYKKSYKKSNDENNLEDFTEVELQGKHDLLKAQSVMKWMENMALVVSSFAFYVLTLLDQIVRQYFYKYLHAIINS